MTLSETSFTIEIAVTAVAPHRRVGVADGTPRKLLGVLERVSQYKSRQCLSV